MVRFHIAEVDQGDGADLEHFISLRLSSEGKGRFTQAVFDRRRPPTREEIGLGHTHAAQYRETVQGQREETSVAVDGTHLQVDLRPGCEIRLELGMERFVNTPTYALPWA